MRSIVVDPLVNTPTDFGILSLISIAFDKFLGLLGARKEFQIGTRNNMISK